MKDMGAVRGHRISSPIAFLPSSEVGSQCYSVAPFIEGHVSLLLSRITV